MWEVKSSMKRKVICVFSLMAFLLVFCTSLAPSVQREMRTEIQIKKIYEALKLHNHPVPKMALSWPDGPKLYQVVEGKGWNTGDRVEEVPKMSYYVITASNPITGEEWVHGAEIYPGKKFDIILAASRQPVVGDAVIVVEEFQEREDTYIICYPKGAGKPEAFPPSFTPVAQNDTTLIVTPTKAYAPYFEQQVLNSLEGMEAPELRAYSVADIRQFYQMLPLVTVLGLIALLGILLWGYSCVLSGRDGNSTLVWRNVILAGGLLGLTPWIASRIDLPTSLLPRSNILDIGHYRSQFRQIFGALESVGSDLLLQERSQCLWICVGILVGGVLLMAALVCIDCLRKKK